MRLKSLLSILIVFASASQLYAQGQVTFIATDNMDGTCTITFDSNDLMGINPVAMALEIHIDGSDPCHAVTGVAGIDSFFDIYMDYAYDIVSDPCGVIPLGYNYGDGHPVSKVDEAGALALPQHDFVICMAGLGGAAKPLAQAPDNGPAFVLEFANAIYDPCNPISGSISANALRGGVIGTDGEPMYTNLTLPFSLNNEPHCDCCPPALTQEQCFAIGCPSCWCYQYQCKGDADGTFDGKDQDGKRKWVNLPDLTIFGAGWLKVDTEAGFSTWICADFDHTFDGKDQDGKRKWVNLPDLTIFGAGWLKVDTEPHFTENPCW